MTAQASPVNYYQDIAGYYDLLMECGYYDRAQLAAAVKACIGDRKSILELGVGTGQMAKELLELDPTYDFGGIDFSAAMLEIAKRQLAGRASLVECDVANMNLGRTFDVVLSSGGTWVIVKSDQGLQLGTHLFDRENDMRGLQNTANHLAPGGIVLLSVHPPHCDRTLDLGNGMTYSQKIGENRGGTDHFYVEKTYSFSRGNETLAEEKLTLGFYAEDVSRSMFVKVGLRPLGLTETGEFFLLEKAG